MRRRSSFPLGEKSPRGSGIISDIRAQEAVPPPPPPVKDPIFTSPQVVYNAGLGRCFFLSRRYAAGLGPSICCRMHSGILVLFVVDRCASWVVFLSVFGKTMLQVQVAASSFLCALFPPFLYFSTIHVMLEKKIALSCCTLTRHVHAFGVICLP